ncbi:Phytochrome-like protein cph2 [compost metagenome]
MNATPPSPPVFEASAALALIRKLASEAGRTRDPQARTALLLEQACGLVGAPQGALMLGNTLDQTARFGSESPLDLPRDLLAEAMLERKLAARPLEGGRWGMVLPLVVGADPIAQLYLEAADAPAPFSLELLETYALSMAQLLYEANARKVLKKTRDAFEEKLDMALGLYDLYHAAVGEAMTDRLTGVGSRAYFDQRLSEQLDHARRYRHPLTLVLMDVDHFKAINDTYGHPAGDQVLAGVGTLLRGSVRLSDVAARYGGEEFALILPFTDAEGAWILADRLRQSLQEWTLILSEGLVQVTASFGLAELTEGMDAAALVLAADRALYQAKHGGRNQVRTAERIDG